MLLCKVSWVSPGLKARLEWQPYLESLDRGDKLKPMKPTATSLNVIIRALAKLCGGRCIAFHADPGRRKSDFLMINMWGDKVRVLQVLPYLTDYLKGVDLEIIQSGRRGQDYFLVFAITKKLATQSLQAPERRAKMHHQTASQARRRVISHHLATASEVKKSRRLKRVGSKITRTSHPVVGLDQKPI